LPPKDLKNRTANPSDPLPLAEEDIAMSPLIRVLFVLMVMPATAIAAEVTGSVSAVKGDTVVIAAAAPAGAGDPVEIYFKVPGLEELGKVGSGRVVSVEGGRVVARIEQSSGKLAIGQIAKIQASGAAPLPPPVLDPDPSGHPRVHTPPSKVPKPPPLGPWEPGNR
jgi:hypothetical protein